MRGKGIDRGEQFHMAYGPAMSVQGHRDRALAIAMGVVVVCLWFTIALAVVIQWEITPWDLLAWLVD